MTIGKGKAYRTLTVRLPLEDFENFEKAQEILQKKTENAAGIETTVSKPDLVKFLVRNFIEQNKPN